MAGGAESNRVVWAIQARLRPGRRRFWKRESAGAPKAAQRAAGGGCAGGRKPSSGLLVAETSRLVQLSLLDPFWCLVGISEFRPRKVISFFSGGSENGQPRFAWFLPLWVSVQTHLFILNPWLERSTQPSAPFELLSFASCPSSHVCWWCKSGHVLRLHF